VATFPILGTDSRYGTDLQNLFRGKVLKFNDKNHFFKIGQRIDAAGTGNVAER
jgi:hypothetical protein